MAGYKITVPIEKAETSDGRWVVRGKAAGVGHVDDEKQTLRAEAIERLARRINDTPIPFKDWHAKNTSFSEMGVVTSATVTPDFELDVEVELDQKHPFAQLLWQKLDEGKQYGMSIGGKSEDWKVEEVDGEKVLAVYDVDIDEISLTTKPLWSPSLGTVIKKAIDEEQQSESVEGENKVAEETTPVVADTPAPESQTESTSAPENVESVTEPVAVEKAVSTDTAREGQKMARLVKHIQETNRLLSELGLAEVIKEDSKADAVEAVQVVEKSTDESEDPISRLIEMLKADKKEIKDELELLKSQIADTPVPGVLQRRDPAEEAIEILKSADPMERMRLGLALKFNEGDKFR